MALQRICDLSSPLLNSTATKDAARVGLVRFYLRGGGEVADIDPRVERGYVDSVSDKVRVVAGKPLIPPRFVDLKAPIV